MKQNIFLIKCIFLKIALSVDDPAKDISVEVRDLNT